jgi:hypothetical protein
MKLRACLAAPLALACLLFMTACHDTSNHAAVATDVSVGQVRSALQQKNFGEASTLADQLTAANPTSADAWLAAADAKAAAGNRLAALAALESAMSNGMRDIAQLDADGYLDAVRSSPEYQALLVRFGLAQPITQAGDTSITETAGGTVVKAGDVSVTLPNSR